MEPTTTEANTRRVAIPSINTIGGNRLLPGPQEQTAYRAMKDGRTKAAQANIGFPGKNIPKANPAINAKTNVVA